MKRSLLALAVVALTSNACADDALKQRLLKEGPQAWKTFQEQHRPAKVVFSWHTTDPDTEKDKVIQTTEIRRAEGAILILEQDPTAESVSGKVGSYAYRARTVAGAPAWKGQVIQPINKAAEDYLDTWGYRWLDFPIAPAGIRMPDLIKAEGVAIKSVENVDDGTKVKKVRLVFACENGYQDLPGAESPIKSGEVILNPDRLWTVDKAVLQTGEGEVTVTMKYGKPDQGKLVVLSNEVRIKADKRSEVVITRKYDEYSHAPLKKAAFLPSQFGLPVPEEDD